MTSFNLLDIFLYTHPLLVVVFIFLSSAQDSRRMLKSPPEPPGAWPLLGHLHYLLGGDKLLHRSLAALADGCGPAFLIRRGTHGALVVSSWELVKECFTINDKVFPSRPQSSAIKIMGYNHTIFGFAPYGPYWRNLRKLAAVELLSSQRLELLKHVRDSEVKTFLEELYELCPQNGHGSVVLDLKQKFGDLAMNILEGIMAGKRHSSKDLAVLEEEGKLSA